ncbi:prostaglandin E2 receptor EP3 subtype isoform X2 [Cygnus olor]|uniref:prostaglandin E2 receptor EP3 subtype isoform X2 n=1 Tax=Cygnus olor TaxID=8869 RepID=UPI001ADEA21D|nr:prostaglandin E2 receptor EP3 subtype isoform X2 [Cygnus olor]
MSRRPLCQGGPNGTEPGAMRPRGNGTGRAAEGCGAVSVAFPLTMMITGVVGNALAMLLVSRSYRAKENRRKRSFLLCIGSLALTDLAGQLLTSPIVISVYLSDRTWAAVDPSGRLCAFFGFSMTVFGLCPLFIASAMAVERTLAIRTPHWYASHMKTRMTKTALLGIWLAVISFALLPIAGLGRYTLQWPGTWCFISTGDGELTGSFFASTFAGLGLFSLVVTVACNLATIEALVSRCRTKATAPRSSKQWGRITTETLIQLLGIMCVLSACWSPLLQMESQLLLFKETKTLLPCCWSGPVSQTPPSLSQATARLLIRHPEDSSKGTDAARGQLPAPPRQPALLPAVVLLSDSGTGEKP